MPVEITFIRHGQTVGNLAGRWQGHTNSSLTDLGEHQAGLLSERFAGKHFDLVIASDLDRTVETATALQRPTETDERWREPFFGEWEDRQTSEIMSSYPAELAALFAGEDVSMGGGERLSQVMARTREALDDVVARIGDGSVAVVSHGMALLTLFSGLLGTKRPSPLRLLGNTSIATVTVDDRAITVHRYNDDTHLGHTVPHHFGHDASDTELVLIRHGETVSNGEGRWQGHQDGMLSATGRQQAEQLAASLPPLDALYSSPLSRAADTATPIAAEQALEIKLDERLKEIGFGAWEGMTRAEIAAEFPDDYAAFLAGVDGPRGGTGETLTGVQLRMDEALRVIVDRHPGEKVGVVSHGGATRAWVTDVLGIPCENRNRLSILDNTGYARIIVGGQGTSVLSWNLGS